MELTNYQIIEKIYSALNKKIEDVIEYDGAQHFFEKHQLTSDKKLAKKLFEDVQIRDKEKTLFCLKHGVRLLRIPYFKFKEIPTILTHEILRNSSKQSS